MEVTVTERDLPDLELRVATPDDAAALVEVIHAAFGARPALDPPSTAIDETPESVAAVLRTSAGILATVDGRPAGALLVVGVGPGLATFQRVSVHPDFQRTGVASAMVAAAQELAATSGYAHVELFAREELADLIAFWHHRGFLPVRPAPHGVVLGRELPVVVAVPTAAAMRGLGERLAALVAPGDVVIASGGLGAGKTTLTQGVGRGLGSDHAVISPTFVLSRVHPGGPGRPDLVHVDAYRLSGPGELDDLDLDATLARSVTVVEWGEGMAEGLSDSRLEIDIRLDDDQRPTDQSPTDQTRDDQPRTVVIRAVGERWRAADLSALRKAG